MFIIKEKMSFSDITKIDGEVFFPEDNMVKAVVDIDKKIMAVDSQGVEEMCAALKKERL